MKRWSRPLACIVLIVISIMVMCFAYYIQYQTCRVPVLMYHHFDESSSSDTVVSESRFREQMEALSEAGFEAITLEQMYNFVHYKVPLPNKPVLITMDDGYTSNLEMAAPILEELGMCATVFVIGINEGEPVYIHSGEPFYQERFSYGEALPWVEKGVIDVQCHTYDMHQLESYGFSGRDGMYPLSGESNELYHAAVDADFARFRERRADIIQTELLGLAYPFGYYTEELDLFLEEEIEITFTIEPHVNILATWAPKTLRMMGRYNVTDHISGAALVEQLEIAILE